MGVQHRTLLSGCPGGDPGKSFGVAVINVNEFDDEGTVFGRPDQVELDIVIHNGTLRLIEIKSSVSRADMYVFERKVRFYERRHGRKAHRLILISPMIDPRAGAIGKHLGIEMYVDSTKVPVQQRNGMGEGDEG